MDLAESKRKRLKKIWHYGGFKKRLSFCIAPRLASLLRTCLALPTAVFKYCPAVGSLNAHGRGWSTNTLACPPETPVTHPTVTGSALYPTLTPAVTAVPAVTPRSLYRRMPSGVPPIYSRETPAITPRSLYRCRCALVSGGRITDTPAVTKITDRYRAKEFMEFSGLHGSSASLNHSDSIKSRTNIQKDVNISSTNWRRGSSHDR